VVKSPMRVQQRDSADYAAVRVQLLCPLEYLHTSPVLHIWCAIYVLRKGSRLLFPSLVVLSAGVGIKDIIVSP